MSASVHWKEQLGPSFLWKMKRPATLTPTTKTCRWGARVGGPFLTPNTSMTDSDGKIPIDFHIGAIFNLHYFESDDHDFHRCPRRQGLDKEISTRPLWGISRAQEAQR